MSASLHQWVDEYIVYLRDERQFSSHTYTGYLRQLNVIIEIMAQYNIPNWQALTVDHVKLIVKHSRQLQIKTAHLALRLSALRSFLNWAVRKKYLSINPAKGTFRIKAEKRLPKNMDVDEVDQLLNIPVTDSLSLRDKAMLEIMYSCGLRVSEMVNLDCQSINLQSGDVQVIGKGDKERRLPLGKVAIDYLTQWLVVREQFKPTTNALFLSRLGRRISVRNVELRFANWGIKRGIHGHVHPHKLRHSFASHMLESSGDLRAVQELLGHANLSTTQIYTYLDFQHLSKVYDGTHPRAKRKVQK